MVSRKSWVLEPFDPISTEILESFESRVLSLVLVYASPLDFQTRSLGVSASLGIYHSSPLISKINIPFTKLNRLFFISFHRKTHCICNKSFFHVKVSSILILKPQNFDLPNRHVARNNPLKISREGWGEGGELSLSLTIH